jgi:hypothetical protein
MNKKQEVSDLEVARKMIKIHQSAADRKLHFDLSLETVRKLLTYKTCYYTNKEFDEDGAFSRSFDRVDSSKGYIEGNVVSCTVDINGKKSNLTFDEIAALYHKLKPFVAEEQGQEIGVDVQEEPEQQIGVKVRKPRPPKRKKPNAENVNKEV